MIATDTIPLTEYEGAALDLKEWGIPLVKVDGTREKELADQYGIGGWPQFKLFRKDVFLITMVHEKNKTSSIL